MKETRPCSLERLVGAYFNAARNAAYDDFNNGKKVIDGDEHENVSEFKNVTNRESNSDFAQWQFESLKDVRALLGHVQARTRTHALTHTHTHTHTHAHTRTHARTQRTHTHTHTRTPAHIHTQQAHARTHKHTRTRA